MKGKVGKNVIMTISYKEDKDPIIAELDIIAARERKSRSQLIVSLIEEYVKAHGSGNTTFKLDNWQDPTFQAVPTILSDSENWYSYIMGCKREEKLRLLKQVNLIRSQIISLGLK